MQLDSMIPDEIVRVPKIQERRLKGRDDDIFLEV